MRRSMVLGMPLGSTSSKVREMENGRMGNERGSYSERGEREGQWVVQYKWGLLGKFHFSHPWTLGQYSRVWRVTVAGGNLREIGSSTQRRQNFEKRKIIKKHLSMLRSPQSTGHEKSLQQHHFLLMLKVCNRVESTSKASGA